MRTYIPRLIKPVETLAPQIDYQHAFMKGLCFGMLFDHRSTRYLGNTDGSAAGGTVTPTLSGFWGSVAPQTINVKMGEGIPQTFGAKLSVSTPYYSSSREGYGPTWFSADYVEWPVDPLPTTQVTICFIRRLWDTTQSQIALGNTWTIGNKQCALTFPYDGDGNCYWDWGGTSNGTTRLVISGQSFSNSPERPDRIVLTAGPAGMAVWRNGVKIGSQATANPGRTYDAAQYFRIGFVTGFNGSRQQVYYIHVNSVQWSDALCRWWSGDPYAHLYQPSYQALGRVAAGAAARQYGYII
jgi:hypothetical protein